MKKYYEAKITMFDENNIPETKETICIKADVQPTVEDIELEFCDSVDKNAGDELRDIREISEEEALEEFGDEIVEW